MQSNRDRRDKPLIILLGVFVALALFYSIILPLFEGPDEDNHFRYAKFIADHGALPVQLFEPGGGIAGHQGWQPPLYYSLVALVLAPIDTSDYEQRLWRNYAATFVGDPSCCGRNIYYHTESENFPYTRTTLAVHLARLLSILFGAITVAATFGIARQLSIVNYQLAIAAAAIVAFNPSFLFASALVSNDAMLAAFSSLVVLLWVRLLTGETASGAVIASEAKQSPNRTLEIASSASFDSISASLRFRSGRLLAMTRSAALLGVLIGLGILTKTTALGLIPFSMLVLIIAAWRKRDARLAIISNAVMLALIALICGWWFARNQMLYGDPLAYRLMIASAIFPRAGELTFPELFQISLPWLWQTFWGGPTPGDFAPALLIVLGAMALLAFIGMIVFAIRNAARQFAIRNSLLLLSAWLAFILVAQIQFIRTTTGADQGRYLFPAISVIALFFGLGLNTLAQHASRLSPLASRFGSLAHWLIGSFFLLALYVPFAYTLPAYARPSLLSSNELTRIAHPVNATFADQFELLGYDLDARAVKPGDTLRVALYWRARAPMAESYRVFVHLIGADDRSAGGADVIPARGAFPTVYWKPGDALRDVVAIPIAPDAPPGKYEIQVGAYPVGKPGERLPLAGSEESHVKLTAIKIAPRDVERAAFDPRARVNANFADQIELLGYDVSANQNALELTLYWRARVAPDRDYTVFIHALDANGKIIAQADRPPRPYPTSLWDAGEQLRDDYALALPPGTIVARMIVGLYRAETGERLPVGASDHIEIISRGVGR
ncbi:MAG: phospholipid carrier-dependent glycosyltransferase [Chloroflexi bacterium]|nr:phospholipid carrier-dependent glycosyltransferase [Chloroflexota bacterium]